MSNRHPIFHRWLDTTRQTTTTHTLHEYVCLMRIALDPCQLSLQTHRNGTYTLVCRHEVMYEFSDHFAQLARTLHTALDYYTVDHKELEALTSESMTETFQTCVDCGYAPAFMRCRQVVAQDMCTGGFRPKFKHKTPVYRMNPFAFHNRQESLVHGSIVHTRR